MYHPYSGHFVEKERSQIVLKEGLLFRRGIAFLEPDKVVLKGHKTEERVLKQDADFVRGLYKRLG